MRYRLVPTRSLSRNRKEAAKWRTAGHVWGLEEALEAARGYYSDTKVPVAVCEAPEDGTVKYVETVPIQGRRRR